MANDSELEAEYEQHIVRLRELDEQMKSYYAARGWRCECGTAIDKDGGMSGWAVVTKAPNAKSYLQTMSENADKIRRQNEEKKKEKNSLLGELQDKYSNFDITSGILSQNQMSSKSGGFQGVIINPVYLSKAEKDSQTAKDLDEMLSGVESAQKWLADAFRRDGLELIAGGYYMDENGNMSSWSLVKKKDSMFDGLAEQGKKIEKRMEDKREKLKEQKKTEEKRAEREKKEKLSGQKVDYRI